MLTPGADPVRKVSIIPRGMALGVTLSTPDSDRVSYSREDLEAKIRVALGGRVAEEVVYGTITSGAESDIQQLTADRAPDGRALGDERGGRPDRRAARRRPGTAPARRAARPRSRPSALIDEEVRRLVESAHDEVTRLLVEHREQLESLAQALLKAETLDAPQAYTAAGIPEHEDRTPVAT